MNIMKNMNYYNTEAGFWLILLIFKYFYSKPPSDISYSDLDL